jgi:hypothetical protein
MIGDFNLPDIDWRAGKAGSKGKDIISMAIEAGMEQLVDFETHCKGNILDLVLTNCAERIQSISECGKLGNSQSWACRALSVTKLSL